MDKQAQLLSLGQGLERASRGRDWAALARVDAELAGALRQWPSLAGWSAAEREALKTLRRLHAQAREHCEAELQALGATLKDMREGRDRWQAYAQSTHWQDEQGDPA
jgi:hypothetical protein